MGGQLKLSGSLIAGPTQATDGGFPAMLANAPLSTKENPKGYVQATGILCRGVTTVAGVFQDLGEPGNVVGEALTLYFRSDNLVILRETVDDGAGGDIINNNPVDGLYVREYPSARFLKTLEIDTQGNAVQVEYFLAGNA